MLFAHTETGVALNVNDDATIEKYRARFTPESMSGWTVKPVPPGTLDNAKDNGDGTFSNPNIPQPPTARLRLTRQDFRALVRGVFGGNAAAVAKLQTYLDAAKANAGTATADKAMRFALDSIQTNTDFSYEDADDIMSAIQFSGADKAAVLNKWPQA